MAARTRRIRQTEDTRAKIQASQLINRLTKHALSDKEVMTASQVRAAEVLLKKTLPDLSNIDVAADVNGTVQVELVSYSNPQ